MDALSLDDLAEEAHWRARLATEAEPSGAVLVRIFGVALGGDGRIDFGRHPQSFMPRWEFCYYAPDSKRWLSVSWLSPAFATAAAATTAAATTAATTSPFLDENAGTCSSLRALAGVEMALPTSRHIAARFAAYSDVGWRGTEADVLVLSNEDDVGDVVVASNGVTTWRVPLGRLDAAFCD